MNSIRSAYFHPNPLHKDTRTSLVILGILLAVAAGVLVLQSFVYGTQIPQLLETGQQVWGDALLLMLRNLAIWAVVLAVLFAIQYVTQPVVKYGTEFWRAVVTGFPLGLLLPFLLVLGTGIVLYIPLGLLSLLIADILPYATLQFAWLAASYLVFLWIVVGIIPLLIEVFLLRRWYYKFIAVLLFLQLTLDVSQSLLGVLEILLEDSVWQTNNIAQLLALFGSLLVSIIAVLWMLRGKPVLTIVYAITGIYIAAIVTGNFSERLFHWGEVPAAILALLSPLVYVQAVKWILRKDGTAIAGLAAGYIGLLSGLFFIQLLRLRISGQGWISLLYGVIVVLGLGLILGMLLGRRITKLVANRLKFSSTILKYMDIGMNAGIMAGMLVGGFLAR